VEPRSESPVSQTGAATWTCPSPRSPLRLSFTFWIGATAQLSRGPPVSYPGHHAARIGAEIKNGATVLLHPPPPPTFVFNTRQFITSRDNFTSTANLRCPETSIARPCESATESRVPLRCRWKQYVPPKNVLSFYQTTRHNIPGVSNLHRQRRKNPKSRQLNDCVWTWKQQVPPKRQQWPVTLQGVTPDKEVIACDPPVAQQLSR
jgi:hypothetical protein